jgi:peptidoglycan/xylan/chitin deacetylase (PgdA/CDA1 family)
VLSVCLLLALACAPSASPAMGDQLMRNANVDAGGSSPAFWTTSTWGDHQPAFTWSTDSPHSGSGSLRIEVSEHAGGDSKWVPVTGGAYYTFSNWYKSNASTAVSVYYELDTDTDGDGDGLIDGHWANLFSGIAPASEWTQYKTGFTMPAGAVRARFVHFIARNGWLQTDDYSLTEEDAPAGFSRPMISLTFDDGSKGFWNYARDPLNAKGFKTTQYVPTAGLTSTPRDTFMMTPDEITTLAHEGHEIAAHSVTHPFMTMLTDPELAAELGDSKMILEALPGVGTIRNFAYPFGDYDARVIAAEEAAGYRSGRSVEEGYNSKLDLEPYDIRVQNMTPGTTPEQFKSWIDYAKAHNYWLVIVDHEVVPESAPRCTNTPADPEPCVGNFDTTVGDFNAQLDAISSAGLGSDVMTVQKALDTIDNEMHGPQPGAVEVAPAGPTTNGTVTAAPSGFSDPDADALTYEYQWSVNGTAISGATGESFDLTAAGHGDRGDVVSVDVVARDPKGHVSTGVNDGVTVVNHAPVKGSVAIDPSSPLAGTALTATPAGFSDADGDELTYIYAWFRNDEAIDGATTNTLPASIFGEGDDIRVEVHAEDGHSGTSELAKASVRIADKPPVVTPAPIPTAPAPPVASPDRTAPKIVVTRPEARKYKVGQTLKVKVLGTDDSGFAEWTATVRRGGGKSRTVKQGAKLRLSRTGSYVLRVTAKDRSGNLAHKTVRFRVVR